MACRSGRWEDRSASAAITRISLTSGEGLVPIYSIVFVLALAAMVGAVAGGAMLGLVTSSTVKLLLGVSS
jgi:hypothetical protein